MTNDADVSYIPKGTRDIALPYHSQRSKLGLDLDRPFIIIKRQVDIEHT